MTINDIAGLAGVSVSTVSKIINGKDAGIKNETRERVLKIVKDYRYKPYDFIKKNTGAKNFLLGLLLSGTKKRDSFQRGFLHEAEKRGYQVQVCLASSAESELKHIAALCKNRADAILRERIAGDDAEALSLLHKSGISCVLLGEGDSEDSISYDYKKAGYDAAKIVITSGHTKIHCLYDPTDERQ